MENVVHVALQDLLHDFRKYPEKYFTEEDIRWRFMAFLSQLLRKHGTEVVSIQDGRTSVLHGEYPTPFRCKMPGRTFTIAPPESKARRGHFDIVLLDPDSIRGCSFEVVRAQFYRKFLAHLSSLPMPFVDTIIELKLFRDLAHPNRTVSATRQGEYAVQAILKTVAALLPQIGYYTKPFARRGIVLLLDNSELAATSDVAVARSKFLNTFNGELNWRELPASLEAIYARSGKEKRFFGYK